MLTMYTIRVPRLHATLAFFLVAFYLFWQFFILGSSTSSYSCISELFPCIACGDEVAFPEIVVPAPAQPKAYVPPADFVAQRPVGLVSDVSSKAFDSYPTTSVPEVRPLSIFPASRKTPPQTHAHINGFTILDELYLRNGVFYIVTSDPSSIPDRRTMISAAKDLGPDMDPTDRELQIIDPEQAKTILGERAPLRMDDFTAIVYDTNQFINHYYHWWGELVLGFWRVYSTLFRDSDLSGSGATSVTGDSLSFPSRFILPLVEEGAWRDGPNVISPLTRAAYPSVSIESAPHWRDLIKLNRTIVFKRAALMNRAAAHTHQDTNRFSKMIGGAMSLEVHDGFWEPVRVNVLRNMLGYVPLPGTQGSSLYDGVESDLLGDSSRKPIVTYISRQSANSRRLTNEAHESLISALKELEEEGICELHTPVMERMSLAEQVELAAKTTIMLGVHGNGLTHQLWMPSTRQSAVMEIFIPEGYLFDYEFLARNAGHRHFAIWNDTYVTYRRGEHHEAPSMPDGFQGTQIPVHGQSVAKLIRQRLQRDLSPRIPDALLSNYDLE